MMALAIVDADSIYFRAAMSNQKPKEIRTMINTIMLDVEGQCLAEAMKVAVKGKGNFRQDLYPQYKATRPQARRTH